jgi:hypothetical protein
MSLLDDETLKEVGRFFLEFNAFDELVTALATVALECAEWETAQHLTERLTAGQKLQRIDSVRATLAKLHELAGTNSYRELSEQLNLARGINAERNTVIHGELAIIWSKRPKVQLREQTVELTPGSLSALVQRIRVTTDGLLSAYNDFMYAVGEAREATSESKTTRHNERR